MRNKSICKKCKYYKTESCSVWLYVKPLPTECSDFTKNKEPFRGWPFKTWSQGYVYGLVNGITLASIIIGIILLLVTN